MTKRLVALATLALASVALTGCFPMTVTKPETRTETVEETTAPTEEAAAKEGTRETPFPIGSTIEVTDWALTVNSVTLDATEALTAENLFNEAPASGELYTMVNITVTYTGTNPDGEMPSPVIEYVTSGGNTVNSFDRMIIPPEQFSPLETLYSGASTTGNIVFVVPSDGADQGTLAVRPYMLSDKVFVSVT